MTKIIARDIIQIFQHFLHPSEHSEEKKSNIVVEALTDESCTVVNKPRWSNHLHRPTVHTRCHTICQDWSCGEQMKRGVIIWLVLWEWLCWASNTICTWIWSTPLRASNGLFDQHTHSTTTNSAGLISWSQISLLWFYIFSMQCIREREKS